MWRLSGHSDSCIAVSDIECTCGHNSTLVLILFHIYLYGWNVYTWQRTRINYPFIFEFSPGTELRYREVLLVSTGFTNLLFGGMCIHVLVSSRDFPRNYASEFIPLVIVLVCSLYLTVFVFRDLFIDVFLMLRISLPFVFS